MGNLPTIFIKEFMTKDVVVLGPKETMADAYEKMHTHQVRHLPVVNENGELVGIFSSTDLNRAYTPRQTVSGWYYDKEGLNLLNLAHFMTKDPLALTPEDTLTKAADIMVCTKFGCLPIIASGTRQLVGIISYVDVLREIVKHL